MKLDEKLSQALVNLRANSDYQVFLEALREYERVTVDKMVAHDGTLMSRAQGSVQTLRDILKANTEAPSTLERFKSSNRK